MARNTIDYTVSTPGRDLGKVFVITEMSSAQGEEWALKALLALGSSVPPEALQLGMAAMSKIGLEGLLSVKFEVLKPLLDEMMSCVKIRPSAHIVRELIEEDIEEIMTRVNLRKEVWAINTGFLRAVAPSISANSQAAAQ